MASKQQREADRLEAQETFERAQPVVRLFAAFVLYVRAPDAGIDRAFQLADQFMARASRELEAPK